MPGYWQDPEATSEVLDAQGWLHTGDVARQDEDGFVYIVGRKKDMIISGGFNIYPLEVERVIEGHPGVQEVAVIGVPDAIWGEAVKAVVVPRPGVTIVPEDITRCAPGTLRRTKTSIRGHCGGTAQKFSGQNSQT